MLSVPSGQSALGLTRAIAIASLAATIVQPIAFAAIVFLPAVLLGATLTVPRADDAKVFIFLVLVVASAHILLLGVPGFLLLRRMNRLDTRRIAWLGFAAGTLPLAIVSWPLAHDYPGYSEWANWYGRAVTLIDHGTTTFFGWLIYIVRIVAFGLLGVLGSLIFWHVWKRFTPNGR